MPASAWSGAALHPLIETGRALGAVYARFGFDLDVPDGPGWVRLRAFTEPAVLGVWLDALAAKAGGHRDVAASYLGLWYAGAVARPLVAAYIADARVPRADDGVAAIRSQANDEIDRLALGAQRFVLLADDPAAGHPDAEVVAVDALGDALADALQALIEPFVTAVRPLAPYGRRGLWGATADMIVGGALLLARRRDLDQRHTWSTASDIVDRLALRGVPVNNRPRPLAVQWAGRETVFTIKGTCCLRYKDPSRVHHAVELPAGYCGACPLIDDEPRMRHYLHGVQRDATTNANAALKSS